MKKKFIKRDNLNPEATVKKVPASAKLEKIYQDKDWKHYKNKPVIPLGMDDLANSLIGNFESFFSLFVVGRNDSERKMFLDSSIVNVLKNTNPDEFKFILIDTKKTFLKPYKNLPNLLFPIITNTEEAKKALDWCKAEVNRRLNIMVSRAGGFIDDYNKKFKNDKIPRILVIINDYADLSKKNARYMKKILYDINIFGMLYGVHLLVSSSGLSKDNCPFRFSKAFHYVTFKVDSLAESKLIIDTEGAEKLRGKGDAILKLPSEKQIRHMRCFSVSKDEIKKVVASIK